MLFTVFCRISNILKNHAFWQTIRIWFEDNFTFLGPCPPPLLSADISPALQDVPAPLPSSHLQTCRHLAGSTNGQNGSSSSLHADTPPPVLQVFPFLCHPAGKLLSLYIIDFFSPELSMPLTHVSL